MIYVYALDLKKIPDPKEYPELLQYIPQMRREKIMRYKKVDGRKQSFGAGLLLQEVMNRYEIKEEDIYIGENGKPETKNICFNLSHSKELAICVVDKEAVGCDVEKIEKAPMDIARKRFCKSEVEYLDSVPEIKRNEQFFRLWTMKESYIKMTGEGMRLSLNRIEFEIHGESVQVKRDGVIQKCFIKEYDIPGFQVTVCGKSSEFASNVEFLDVSFFENVSICN